MSNLAYNPNTKTVHSSTTYVNSQHFVPANSPVYKGAYTPYTHSSPTPQNPSSVGGHSGKVSRGTLFYHRSECNIVISFRISKFFFYYFTLAFFALS